MLLFDCGRIWRYTLASLPPFFFPLSLVLLMLPNSISQSRFACGQTCRITCPFCFVFPGVICSDCSGACSGTGFVQGFLSHLCSVSFLLPGSCVFSFLVCCFCWRISGNSLLKNKHGRYIFRELNLEKCLYPLSCSVVWVHI